MERIYFKTMADLSDYMIEKSMEESVVTSILFYKETLELIRELMVHDDITVNEIDLSSESYDGYDKEYYITLDNEGFLYVEPAFVDNGYLYNDADLTLVHGDASYAVIKDLYENKCKEVIIGFDDNCEDFCFNCCEDCSDCEFLTGEELSNIQHVAELLANIRNEPIEIAIKSADELIDYLLI